MREGWEIKSWEDVLEIRSGRNQKEVIDPNGKYPILGSAGNIMGYANDFLCDEGTTIIGRKGTIDNPLYIESKFWNVDTAFGLVAGESIDKRFLYYFCRGFNFKELDKGTTLPSLIKKDLVKIQIPIPPLTEQKQIVAILDEAFAAIDQAKANIEKNIQNAKELFQSKLNEIFSHPSASSGGDGSGYSADKWEEKTLGEAVESISTGPFGSLLHKSDYVTNGVPLVNPINMIDKRIIPDVRKQVNFETLSRLSNYKLATGNIVVARRGEIGRCALVEEEQDGWLCGTGSFFIRPSNLVLPKFLLQLLSSQKCKMTLEAVSTGATMKNISNKALRNLIVTFPSIVEQEIIIKKIDELDSNLTELENLSNRKLKSLDELKKSILQKAFAGELSASGLEDKQDLKERVNQEILKSSES